jgi:anaerobic selenocysteine-containing dehydrogenase
MRGNDLEVAVPMRDGHVEPQRHRCHQAIGHATHRVALSPALTMDCRRVLGVAHPSERLDTKVLQTLRSHDQYNTTIYGLDDRYRGVKGGRRVIFVNPADIASLGFAGGARVDLVSEFTDAAGEVEERRAEDFMIVPYSTPGGQRGGLLPRDQLAGRP